jgi:hypothetical protein
VRSEAATVEGYLAGLPADRREALTAVRDVVRRALPPGYEEAMQYGMITWHVPASRYPGTDDGQPLAYVSLASQKHHMALYLMGVYVDEELERRVREGFRAAGKKLDMGRSCLRFRRLEDLPLDVIADVLPAYPVERLVEKHEAARSR